MSQDAHLSPRLSFLHFQNSPKAASQDTCWIDGFDGLPPFPTIPEQDCAALESSINQAYTLGSGQGQKAQLSPTREAINQHMCDMEGQQVDRVLPNRMKLYFPANCHNITYVCCNLDEFSAVGLWLVLRAHIRIYH
jgi:hypothetical protein